MKNSGPTYPHRSPSAWHDDTMSRDAGHDAMQFAFWQFLHDVPQTEMLVPRRGGRDQVRLTRTAIWFEMPMKIDHRIVGWADVAEAFDGEDQEQHSYRHYIIYEIKPKIYSVGGLKRQVLSLNDLATRWLGGWNARQSSSHEVKAVVPANDPKLFMYRQVAGASHTYAWDYKPE